MLIIADARLPEAIFENLAGFGEPVRFSSHGITYASVEGHPDIFLCQTPDNLIVAPNAPDVLSGITHKSSRRFVTGKQPVGNRYPKSAAYNAFVNRNYLIHNLRYTDSAILEICADMEAIHVNQAYTRCNLVEVVGLYVTSDRGIEKVLKGRQLDVFYVDPGPILLPGEQHGFFGGCCGVNGNTLLITGRLDSLAEGTELRAELLRRGIAIKELYDGPLVDGGSVIFC